MSAIRRRHWHLFLNPGGRRQKGHDTGFYLRFRSSKRNRWAHIRLGLRHDAPRTFRFELCGWRTDGMWHHRRSHKMFIRFKVGLGGPKPSECAGSHAELLTPRAGFNSQGRHDVPANPKVNLD